MQLLVVFSTALVVAQLLVGCSDDSSDDPPPTADAGDVPDLVDPLPDTSGGGLSAGICAIPPDLRAGDVAKYRYTDEAGATMDITFDVASSDGSAIVLDVVEGDSVYRAAVSTFCNDTPELDLAGGDVTPEMQALFDQYTSRPLLLEIVQPSFGRFNDGTVQELDGTFEEDCGESNEVVPALGTEPVPVYACTFSYDLDVAGSSVIVETTLAQTRNLIDDFSRLVEKVQSSANGGQQSLVLVSFESAD